MTTRLEKVKSQALNEILGVTEFYSSNGIGKLKAIVNKNTVNPSGYYHGGAIYALCDVCAITALSSLLDENKEAVTHDIHVSVLRAAVANDQVLYQSKVIKLGKRVAFMDVEVSVKDQLIATARVTKSII